MTDEPLNLAILLSGGGRTLQNLIEEMEEGERLRTLSAHPGHDSHMLLLTVRRHKTVLCFHFFCEKSLVFSHTKN